MSRTATLLVAVTVPPLLIALVGLVHPSPLTVESARHWQTIHTVLLPLFPLVALGPWLTARETHRAGGVVVGVLAYGYATFYTSLDVLAGIAGGAIKDAEAGGLGIVFLVAQDMELIGGLALVAATALAAGLVSRRGWVTAPGIVCVLAGAVMHWREHVYVPWGVLSMVLLAAGWGWLVWVTRPAGAPASAATPDSRGR